MYYFTFEKYKMKKTMNFNIIIFAPAFILHDNKQGKYKLFYLYSIPVTKYKKEIGHYVSHFG